MTQNLDVLNATVALLIRAALLAAMSRSGLNPATDDRVKTSQFPLSVRTPSVFAMHFVHPLTQAATTQR